MPPEARVINANGALMNVPPNCQDLAAFGAVSALATNSILLLFAGPNCSPPCGIVFPSPGPVALGAYAGQVTSARRIP
jgi:hypothetical protein